MATRYWFVPHPGRPMIELGCGYHDKSGKFHPQNVKLTGGPSRFLTVKARKHRVRMVGDPPTLIRSDVPSLESIYAMHMAEKRSRTGNH